MQWLFLKNIARNEFLDSNYPEIKVLHINIIYIIALMNISFPTLFSLFTPVLNILLSAVFLVCLVRHFILFFVYCRLLVCLVQHFIFCLILMPSFGLLSPALHILSIAIFWFA